MNPPLPPSLEPTIAAITHLMSDLEARASQQAGFSDLSMRQVLYLDTIAQLGHPSFSELADALGVTRPSVTALVGKLIRNGYLEKARDDEDRRSFHILLTEKGRQFTEIHQNMHRQIARILTQRLNKSEIEQLAVLLQKAIGDEIAG